MEDGQAYTIETNRIGVLDVSGDPFVGDLMNKLPQIELMAVDFNMIDNHVQYNVILDRASYLYTYLREFLKDISLRGCYVINNPFTMSLHNKIVDAQLCHRLKIPVPQTFVLPDLSFAEEFPVAVTPVSWEKLADELGLPFIIKPYNGYGWDDVYIIHNKEEYQSHYNAATSNRIFIAQQFVQYAQYYRIFSIAKTDLLFTTWIPRPFGAGEYYTYSQSSSDSTFEDISRMTIELNSILDLDINVLEWCLNESGKPYLIDAYNEVPDIPADRLPQECYAWIVDKIAQLILSKAQNPESKNKILFQL